MHWHWVRTSLYKHLSRHKLLLGARKFDIFDWHDTKIIDTSLLICPLHPSRPRKMGAVSIAAEPAFDRRNFLHLHYNDNPFSFCIDVSRREFFACSASSIFIQKRRLPHDKMVSSSRVYDFVTKKKKESPTYRMSDGFIVFGERTTSEGGLDYPTGVLIFCGLLYGTSTAGAGKDHCVVLIFICCKSQHNAKQRGNRAGSWLISRVLISFLSWLSLLHICAKPDPGRWGVWRLFIPSLFFLTSCTIGRRS